MKISNHFDSAEFACKCGCGFDTVSIELLDVLEDLRQVWDQPIKINSGCRCEKHNESVGGTPGSYHTKGMAADIVVCGVSPAKVYQYLTGKYPDKYGIGLYINRVHVDVQKLKHRWTKGG